MQVIASQRAIPGRPTRLRVVADFSWAAILLTLSLTLVYFVFVAGFLDQFTPAGRPSTFQVVSGALAWAFALTAPAGAGLLGLLRLTTAIERYRARRPRITPAVRLARAIGDDHIVATGVRMPDGSRIVPELVIGPFGAAVIEELPLASQVLSRGVRSWEVRSGVGRVRTVESPLERATRDGDRVRTWLSGDETEVVLKVYSAVVGTDPRVERTPSCAVLAPDQLVEWLASLPPQRSLDAHRRDRILKLVRAAL
ncbi:MAG TPA: hypothetical protein VKR30_10150 [Candidatus Limnocylindrales bacterium]|nr:hypothetical protein [Candidatus Limnocylindrales bacterium]